MKPLFRWSGLRAGSPDCRWLHSRMGYYLEGALRPGAMRRANGHLDECPSCQRSATLLEESLAAARGLQPLTPAPDFEDCVWEKIRISREIERQPGLPLTSWRTRAVSAPRLVWVGGGVASLAAAATVMLMVTGAPRTHHELALPGSASNEALSPSVSPTSDEATPWSDVEEASEALVSATSAGPRRAATQRSAPGGAAAPAPALEPSPPQAGDETAPPVGFAPGSALAGAARLEPGSAKGELYFEDARMVPDPWSPDRGYYVIREAVITRPGQARVAF